MGTAEAGKEKVIKSDEERESTEEVAKSGILSEKEAIQLGLEYIENEYGADTSQLTAYAMSSEPHSGTFIEEIDGEMIETNDDSRYWMIHYEDTAHYDAFLRASKEYDKINGLEDFDIASMSDEELLEYTEYLSSIDIDTSPFDQIVDCYDLYYVMINCETGEVKHSGYERMDPTDTSPKG